ncbi:MAG TPA: hypothetical protein VJA94_21620 [Candidatus Angelobacter sp.]
MAQWLIPVLYVAAMITVPIFTIWGWARFFNGAEFRTPASKVSLTGFSIATASAVLAIMTVAVAMVRPFPFYDPLLLTIYMIGLLLSLTAFIVGLFGLARPNPWRWHAPLCGIGMLIFWLISASME